MTNYLECVKCGRPKKENALECPFCGVIYAKAEAVYVRKNPAGHNGISNNMETGNEVAERLRESTIQNVPQWDFYCFLELIFVLAIPFLGLSFAFFHFQESTYYPLFKDLTVKSGILTEVDRSIHTSDKSLAGITVTLNIDGQTEKIKLPIYQDAPRIGDGLGNIGDDLGNEIEIRYDLRPSGKKEIWNVSSESREYFKYQEKLARQKELYRADRNVLLLSILATVYIVLANFKTTIAFVKNLPEKHRLMPVKLPGEMTFVPNNFYPGSILYLFFTFALGPLYYGIFFTPGFLIIGILSPAIALIWFFRKPPTSITLSQEGIKTELLRKKLGLNFVRWTEVEDVYLEIRKGFSHILLSVRINNNSKSIRIIPAGYLNNILLQDLLVQRYTLE